MAGPPVLLECAFASQPNAASPTWTDITAYLELFRQVSYTHGRQDEFSAAQPSTFGCVLDNSDGRFTRDRVASPYYPGVRNGRRIRFSLMFKGNGTQYVEGDPSFESGTNGAAGSGFFGGPAPVSIATSALHTAHGTKSCLITWATGGQGLAAWTIRGLTPGQTYTASFIAFVPAGSPDVQLGVAGITFGAAVATKNATFTLSTTFVATGPSHQLQVIDQTPGGAGTQCFLDAMQVEDGATRTTFEPTPAVWSQRFDGYVDAWPTAWAPGALWAECALTASSRTRRMGRLAELRSMVEEEVQADVPAAYFTLAESSGSVTAGNSAATMQPAAVVGQIGAGGTIDFGAGTGPGTDGLTAAVFTPASATAGKYLISRLSTRVGFFGITLAAYFNTTSTGREICALVDGVNNYLNLSIDGAGRLAASVWDPYAGVAAAAGNSTGAVNDGHTHDAAVTLAISGGTVTLRLYLDGVLVVSPTYTASNLPAYGNLTIGGHKPTGAAAGLFAGTVSHVRAYSSALSAARLLAQAQAGLTGLVERTDQRISRIAGWLGIAGTSLSLEAGSSMVGAQSTSGKAGLDAMREVERTENGVLFDGMAGLLTFHGRAHRYNQTAAITLDCTAVEVGLDLAMPADDFGVFNDVTAGRAQGATARAVAQASIDEYGLYRDPLDLVSSSDDDAVQAAWWRVNNFGTPRTRLPSVLLDLATQPALATRVAGLEVGSRVTITNLPTQAPASTVDTDVEGWAETVGVDEWSMKLNLSPYVGEVWLLGDAVRSVLGVTTIPAY